MDIHPPAGPVHTFKDFLVHLSMIVIGILIAVGLDQLVEWRHHQHLVQEAKANIASEIRDNAKELASTLATYPSTDHDLENIAALLKMFRAHKPMKDYSATLNVHLSTLSMASRSSAESTGALGYMEYADVKRLTAVYDLQQQFLRIQERLLENATMTLAGLKGEPDKATDGELMALSGHAQATRGELSVAASIGKALKTAYEKALQPER